MNTNLLVLLIESRNDEMGTLIAERRLGSSPNLHSRQLMKRKSLALYRVKYNGCDIHGMATDGKTSRETECIRLPCQAVYRDGEGSAREVYIVWRSENAGKNQCRANWQDPSWGNTWSSLSASWPFAMVMDELACRTKISIRCAVWLWHHIL